MWSRHFNTTGALLQSRAPGALQSKRQPPFEKCRRKMVFLFLEMKSQSWENYKATSPPPQTFYLVTFSLISYTLSNQCLGVSLESRLWVFISSGCLQRHVKLVCVLFYDFVSGQINSQILPVTLGGYRQNYFFTYSFKKSSFPCPMWSLARICWIKLPKERS